MYMMVIIINKNIGETTSKTHPHSVNYLSSLYVNDGAFTKRPLSTGKCDVRTMSCIREALPG